MKNNKLKIRIIAALIMTALISTGCANNDTVNEGTTNEKLGIISEEIHVSANVLKVAKEKVQKDFEINSDQFPNYGYTNWRIVSLEDNFTYDNLDGMKVVLYQLNYEFFSESPENIIIAGGMYITEDHWVMPSYPNSNYLIFQQEDDTLSFLESVMINDSSPGTPLFTDDLLQVLKKNKAD